MKLSLYVFSQALLSMLLSLLLCAAVMYLPFSFISRSFNPLLWYTYLRITFVVGYGVSGYQIFSALPDYETSEVKAEREGALANKARKALDDSDDDTYDELMQRSREQLDEGGDTIDWQTHRKLDL